MGIQMQGDRFRAAHAVLICYGYSIKWCVLSEVWEALKFAPIINVITSQTNVYMCLNLGHQINHFAGNLTLLQYDKNTWSHLIEFYQQRKCVVHVKGST